MHFHRVPLHWRKNDSKYLVVSPDNELIDKYEEVWRGIKKEIIAINYGKEFYED